VTGSVEMTGHQNAAARKRKDYSGVVVWLEPLDPRAPRPALAARHTEMIQKDKRFVPHIMVIPVGTQVDFPNFDPIFHNAFSSFGGQPFDVGLYPPGTSRSVTFKRDGIVRVFCNIHQTMSAVIVVLKTPWYAVSNAQGKFQIAGVPPGDYRLRVFYERAPAEVLKGLERKVSVDDPALALPPIVISETAVVPPPHKNKFGQDYPPVPDENVYYPGVKK
jgi:plastocyanin